MYRRDKFTIPAPDGVGRLKKSKSDPRIQYFRHLRPSEELLFPESDDPLIVSAVRPLQKSKSSTALAFGLTPIHGGDAAVIADDAVEGAAVSLAMAHK